MFIRTGVPPGPCSPGPSATASECESFIVRMIGWCVLLVGLACLPTARADERMREVQEELRRRHLYYGEINGQFTPELSAALKHFQARKGFPESGRVDDETLQSLGIASSAAPPSEGPNYPDVPDLKSDAGSHPD